MFFCICSMAVHILHRLPDLDARMIHSKFLGYFDAVARQGSIRKAAAVLNVCSTTVTRKLKDVERDLGVRLLDRTPDGVVLTAAGSIVVEHCRKTLYDFEQLRAVVDDIRSARSGHIQLIAVTPSVPGGARSRQLCRRTVREFLRLGGAAFD